MQTYGHPKRFEPSLLLLPVSQTFNSLLNMLSLLMIINNEHAKAKLYLLKLCPSCPHELLYATA